MTRRGLVAIPLLAVLVACSPGASNPRTANAPGAQPAAAGPKRLVIAVISEPVGFNLAIETQRISVK
jgi:hypothetical protein